MYGFQSGETPLVLVRGQMDHPIPIHIPVRKSHDAEHTLMKKIQTQFFSFRKEQVSRSLPPPPSLDGQGQTGS